MQTPKEGDGRRPFIVPAPSRHMLQEVNKSLSHAVKAQQQQHNPGDTMQIKGTDLGVKPELSKSSPNLVDKPVIMGRPMKRIGYNQRAMAQIKQSLAGFQINGQMGSIISNGYDVEVTPVNQHMLRQLTMTGCDEEVATRALKLTGNKSVEDAVQIIQKLAHCNENRNGFAKMSEAELQMYGSGVTRKASFEQKYRTDSPIHSENSSVRSDSPVLRPVDYNVTPAIPPRGMQILTNGRGQTPPPNLGQGTYDGLGKPIPVHPNMMPQVQQMMKRMSPVLQNVRPVPNSQSHYSGMTPQRGTSPMTARQPLNMSSQGCSPVPLSLQPASMTLVQDWPTVTTQQSMASRVGMMQGSGYNHPPAYGQMASRPQSAPLHAQAPASLQDFNHPSQFSEYSQLSSLASGLTSAELAAILPAGHALPQPVAMQAWSAKQPQILMLQARSREVQKPVLQTATVPLSPPSQTLSERQDALHYSQPDLTNFVSSVQAQVNGLPGQAVPQGKTSQQPQYTLQQTQQQQHQQQQQQMLLQQRLNSSAKSLYNGQSPGMSSANQSPGQSARTIQIHIQNQGTGNVHVHQTTGQSGFNMGHGHTPSPRSESPIPRTYNQSPLSVISTTSTPSTNSDMPEKAPPPYPGPSYSLPGTGLMMKTVREEGHSTPSETHSLDSVPLDIGRDMDDSSSDKQEMETHHCTSPKPERSLEATQRDLIRQETNIKHFSPEAYKFYMEQHFENLMKSCTERNKRRVQLEQEMDNICLSEDARKEVRKMLRQKESNYIRLKRAKIDKSMFKKITTLGIGAFGEVALVSKKDTSQLLAMKTLRKRDVYQRNQVAHVKAERDILAEADNEWVVKLYYSFQDTDNLYFVMDYIPGGDMMSLLIKFGIFEEPLARFYIAELVLAIESVHKMGFIHRDIKPDNILIDRDGHIKLTDFGLCTGFRWTHSSNLYQEKGNHARQDSMEPDESWSDMYRLMDKELRNRPLERRKLQHRCLAHSLVGTPNYIAPEVLLRSGYTSCCDWWSVGVILYEMLVGQPPFLANTPGETQMKVIHYAQTLHIPPEASLSKEAANLIRRLCTGPTDRLGSNGADEIKSHPFFDKIIDIEHLRQQTALYKPTILTPTDTSNFDPVDPEKLFPNGIPHKDGTLENGNHPDHAFFEFTFRRFFDHDTGNAYAQKFDDPETNNPVYV